MFDGNIEQIIMSYFMEYAYQPWFVYGAVCVFMLASSFGFPIPEEIVILSSGLVAHIASRPDLYPPPAEATQGVQIYTLAFVAFWAVLLSDFVVYYLGRKGGPYVVNRPLFSRLIPPKSWNRVIKWMTKYGHWTCGIFRFTPGLRFPGHMACGVTGVPISKFLMIDGMAALVSVPTQILLVGSYGDTILEQMGEAKLILFSLIGLFALYVIARSFFRRRIRKQVTP